MTSFPRNRSWQLQAWDQADGTEDGDSPFNFEENFIISMQKPCDSLLASII